MVSPGVRAGGGRRGTGWRIRQADLVLGVPVPPLTRPVPLLPLQLVLPEYSIHSLFCIMFLCAQEWLTLGLNVPLLFYHVWR